MDNFFKNFKILMFSGYFYLFMAILVFSAYFNFYMSNIIVKLYPDRLLANDILFDTLPYIAWTQYLTDIAVIIGPALVFYYVVKKEPRYMNYYIIVISLIYLIRAAIIPLTPLADVFTNQSTYGITQFVQHGTFPSGHVALSAACYFLIDRKKAPLIKHSLFWLLIIEIVSLLLSRGHYSIDIIGGILVSYFVVTELAKYKQSFLIRENA